MRLKRLLFVSFLCAGSTPTLSMAGGVLEDITRETGSCFSGGCDPVWGLNRRFDDGVRSKAAAMTGPIKEAFIEATTDLFNNKVTPTIKLMNELAEARLAQTDRIVKDAEQGIDELLGHAAVVADKTFGNVREIEQATYADADRLLTRASDEARTLLNDASCVAKGAIENAKTTLQSLLPQLPRLWTDECYRAYDYYHSHPDPADYEDKYKIQECYYLETLSLDKKVEDIVSTYIHLENLAHLTQCAMYGVEAAHDKYTRKAERYRASYFIWALTLSK